MHTLVRQTRDYLEDHPDHPIWDALMTAAEKAMDWVQEIRVFDLESCSMVPITDAAPLSAATRKDPEPFAMETACLIGFSSDDCLFEDYSDFSWGTFIDWYRKSSPEGRMRAIDHAYGQEQAWFIWADECFEAAIAGQVACVNAKEQLRAIIDRRNHARLYDECKSMHIEVYTGEPTHSYGWAQEPTLWVTDALRGYAELGFYGTQPGSCLYDCLWGANIMGEPYGEAHTWVPVYTTFDKGLSWVRNAKLFQDHEAE